jgi:hypothetical protein
MTAPEQRAREGIDASPTAAGWIVQDLTSFNRSAGEGVAVREFELQRLDGVCSAIDKELLRTQALRQCVLRAAFSGQLVAQTESDSTAQRRLSRLTIWLATSTA